MTALGSGDAGRPGAGAAARDFRPPLGARIMILVATVFLGLTLLAVAGITAFSLFERAWLPAALTAALAVFVAALVAYVWRDLAGKWGLRIVLGADALELWLPAGRSLIHRPPKQHLAVRYADIAAIETRFEGYRSWGMAMIQRPYALLMKDGARIFLFEERAMGTTMQSRYFAGIVAEIAARAGVPVVELGMTSGKAGILGVWGTEAADWQAPALPAGEQGRLWRAAATTAALASLAVALAIALRAIVALFR